MFKWSKTSSISGILLFVVTPSGIQNELEWLSSKEGIYYFWFLGSFRLLGPGGWTKRPHTALLLQVTLLQIRFPYEEMGWLIDLSRSIVFFWGRQDINFQVISTKHFRRALVCPNWNVCPWTRDLKDPWLVKPGSMFVSRAQNKNREKMFLDTCVTWIICFTNPSTVHSMTVYILVL